MNVNLTCSRPVHNCTCFQHLSLYSKRLHTNTILSLSPSKDVHYADVSQFHKKDGGSVQLGNQAVPVESTDYAEVRLNGKLPSNTAHLQNSQTKRPAPQPVSTPSIYSEVRKD